MFQNILVLCTGNICRSPYAAAYLKEQVPGLVVASAGLGALVGHGADRTGQQLALARGIDLSDHEARQVNRRLLSEADLVLVMEDAHLKTLFDKYPDTRGKTFKLARWLQDRDITDPFQKSTTLFNLVLDDIEAAVQSWRPKLETQATSRE